MSFGHNTLVIKEEAEVTVEERIAMLGSLMIVENLGPALDHFNLGGKLHEPEAVVAANRVFKLPPLPRPAEIGACVMTEYDKVNAGLAFPGLRNEYGGERMIGLANFIELAKNRYEAQMGIVPDPTDHARW